VASASCLSCVSRLSRTAGGGWKGRAVAGRSRLFWHLFGGALELHLPSPAWRGGVEGHLGAGASDPRLAQDGRRQTGRGDAERINLLQHGLAEALIFGQTWSPHLEGADESASSCHSGQTEFLFVSPVSTSLPSSSVANAGPRHHHYFAGRCHSRCLPQRLTLSSKNELV
jgi:hypothetical protein